jgi:hypothetical protein
MKYSASYMSEIARSSGFETRPVSYPLPLGEGVPPQRDG